MKTIATTVAEAMQKALDESAGASPLAAREQHRKIEAGDGEVFRRHRARLARQTRLLIAEQARP